MGGVRERRGGGGRDRVGGCSGRFMADFCRVGPWYTSFQARGDDRSLVSVVCGEGRM